MDFAGSKMRRRQLDQLRNAAAPLGLICKEIVHFDARQKGGMQRRLSVSVSARLLINNV